VIIFVIYLLHFSLARNNFRKNMLFSVQMVHVTEPIVTLNAKTMDIA